MRKKGERSDVVKTPLGYHILELEDKRGAVLRPFDQVKEKIRFYLQAKKRQDAYLEYVKEAKAKATVVVNEKLWDQEVKKQFKSERTEEKQAEKRAEKKETGGEGSKESKPKEEGR